ncbi:MAG TPA: hypothetical protein PK598_11280, partial [Thermoanaerobaculia bacterium]|nr:hypothetical protein [Thermoanaerobaculia bacterium]
MRIALVVPGGVDRSGTARVIPALLALTHRVSTREAWYSRSEREDVTVSEDYRLEGQRPERPVDEKGTRR